MYNWMCLETEDLTIIQPVHLSDDINIGVGMSKLPFI